MADSEKTVRSKEAYAEILMKTAKEAAARVLVLEKTVASLQHQLNYSKEESLRLLLRLKRMLDAKAIEAETISFNQKRKIDELEAQLHEAEDIIIDLRLEVNCLQDKLERATNAQLKPSIGQITSEDASSLKDLTPEPPAQSLLNSGYVTVSGSDTRDNLLNQGYPDNRSCIAAKQIDRPNISHVECYHPHNSDLAPVLMASEKPELYRNGCTQRICALERNLLDGKFTTGGLDDQHSFLRKEFSMETSAEDERQCTQSSRKTKNLKAMDFSGEKTKKSVKVCTTRRVRKTRFSRTKAGSLRFCPGQRMKPCQSSSFLSCCRTYTINGNVKPCEGSRTVSSIGAGNMDKIKVCKELEEELQRKSSCHEDVAAIDNEERNVKVKCSNYVATSFQSLQDQLTESCQPSSVLSCSRTSNSVCPNVKSNEERVKTAENETKIKLLASLVPGLTPIKCNVDPLSGSENFIVSDEALDKSRFVLSAADNDMKLGDEPVLVRQEGNSREISTLPSSEMSSDMVNVSLAHSDLKDTKASNVNNESSTKVDSINDSLPKYTFQRKRKKELLSNPNEKTSEESSLKWRAGENANSLQETTKSNLDPLSGSENFTVSGKALNKSRFVLSAAEKELKLGDEPVLVRQEDNLGEIPTLPSSAMSFNLVNVSFSRSDFKDTKESNVINESSTKLDSINDRLPKYAFQRKRKKEPLGNPDEKTSEESSLSRRAGENENSLPETAKPNLDPLSGSKYVSESAKAPHRSRFAPSATGNDMKLGDESVLVRLYGNSGGTSTLPASEISSNTVNVSVGNSDLKDTEASNVTIESSTKMDSVKDRLFGCTFQRKCKKEPLGKLDEKASDVSSLKRRAGEKENSLQETAKSNLDPLSGSKCVSVSAKALDRSRFVPSAADNDMKSGDESVLVRQEGNSGETSTPPSSEIISNMVNVSFAHSELKDTKASNVTNESSTKVDSINDRLLKCTFQRKQKKEPLGKPDEKTFEVSSLKRRAGEKENSLQETAKSNLDPLSGSKYVSVCAEALNRSRFVTSAADDDLKLADESVLVRQEGNSGETSTPPSSEISSNMVDVSFAHSDLKDTKASNVINESSTKVDSVRDKLLKCTFQRKRKKEPLSMPDEKTSEVSILKRRAWEKENSLQETAKSNSDPLLRSKYVTVCVMALDKSRFVPSAADNGMKLGDESVLVRQKGNSGVTSALPSSEISSNMVNAHFDLKDIKASNVTHESSTEVDSINDGLLKCTFQRKRKKELLNKPDEKTSEESSLKRRAGEKENSLQEAAKSNLVSESSRDQRHQAQLARQRISRSSKRWR